MRFLVTIDGSDVGVGMPPERLDQVVDQMVVPSLEKLAQWEQEGFTAVAIQLVTSLPHWGLVKVDVKP
jgi:hypothetical protein